MVFRKIRDLIIVLVITVMLSFYLLFVTWNSSPFVDVWPLKGLFWETVAVIVMVTILSCMLFRGTASIIIPLTTQAFLVVVIPVLKYPNALNIVGPWDSAAHYSFAKWIIVNGHVDTAGNLYYSGQYGFHPGNGIIPATLSLLSSISLGWSMNTVLISVYLGYVLLLLATLKMLEKSKLESMSMGKALWLIAIFTLAINLPVYYGGVELGYVFAGGILYVFIKWLFRREIAFVRTVIIAVLVFLGLVFTHLSTATIVVAYVLIAALVLSAVSFFRGKDVIRKNSWKLLVLAFLMVSIFMTYEVCVDVSLFSGILQRALRIIHSMHVRELGKASSMAVGTTSQGMSFMDLLQLLVSNYAKLVIVFGLIFIHTVTLLLRWHSLSSDERILILLLFASYPTWLVGWAGIGRFLSGGRAQGIFCFLLALSLALTYEKLYKPLIKRGAPIIPLVLIALGFVANFGLSFQPAIRRGEDLYTYSTFSQGGFSDYVLHPIIYVSSYANDSPFLCLKPYTGFGLCDLMWLSPKIPKHGSIGPRATETSLDIITELIKNYLGKNVIVPQPMRDRLIPGIIGYHSLYEKPFQLLLEKGKALVYNNELYTAFLV